jgi:hypothetical protein
MINLKRHFLFERGVCAAILLSGIAVSFDLPVSAELHAQQQEGELAEELSVEVAATKLRLQPRHWGASVLDLKYADRVAVVAREGDWVKVEKDGKQGYLHSAALTSRRVLIRGAESGSINVRADQSDVVLAGKGFNAQVEDSYSEGTPEANFAALDQALGLTATEKRAEEKLEKFVKDGGLTQ